MHGAKIIGFRKVIASEAKQSPHNYRGPLRSLRHLSVLCELLSVTEMSQARKRPAKGAMERKARNELFLLQVFIKEFNRSLPCKFGSGFIIPCGGGIIMKSVVHIFIHVQFIADIVLF